MAKENERLMRQFGTRLRAARITAGYETAESFADDIDCQAERLRRYERGETFPTLLLLKRMSEVLGITLDFLLLGVAPSRSRD